MESGILEIGIQKPAAGMWSPHRGIQNPIMSWITLHKVMSIKDPTQNGSLAYENLNFYQFTMGPPQLSAFLLVMNFLPHCMVGIRSP